MKYIVGYPIKPDQQFVEEIIRQREQIAEVYFSWGDLPNGRSGLGLGDERLLFEVQQEQAAHLRRMADEGLSLNLLFNANCYGKHSQSRSFFNRIGNLIDHIQSTYGLSSVTTASPLIAGFVKENFTGIDVRASVNMELGTVEGLTYISNLFDSFYVQRERNRDWKALTRIRRWCDANGKQMYLLANSGCLNHCSAHAFHDNLVAHEAEIAEMDNGYLFEGICRDFLSDAKRRDAWLQRTNFIRPEDVELYSSLTPAMKLATRVNRSPSRVLRAYTEKSYCGGIMELLEPDHSGLFYPKLVENKGIDADFGAKVLHCEKKCDVCRYCFDVMARASVSLDDDVTMKL